MFTSFVGGSAFFILLDYLQWPHFLYKYKMNPGKNAPIEKKKLIKVGKRICYYPLWQEC
jgi:hypothetical protein